MNNLIFFHAILAKSIALEELRLLHIDSFTTTLKVYIDISINI